MASYNHQTPSQSPHRFTGTPKSIIDDAKRIIASRKAQEQIVKNVRQEEATFANVLLPLMRAENTFKLNSHILQFYQHVSLDKDIRDASAEAEKLVNKYEIETSMREDLYHLVDAVVGKDEKLDTESTLLLEKKHRDYIRNGLKLPMGSTRD
ncbi:hypothetical protein ONS95_014501 [Cadophora gregata]|uniref:uncharacterized protein n=1 Tax=Cadophora gregata TaxID=51156 RepID=UPI0026DC25B1|nr:uncharacterized protein ONS95_014501 [Cadophora gregata]KAK0112767.1 hypothetical protein ONS95_014501 [Cadophora gregata]KAK0124899.1 hypothetical protein ONS96_008777 [Cadophora gregata f. sp. sojae]